MQKVYEVNPKGSMDQLSHLEVESLAKTAKSPLYQLYRNCSLAVLNSGIATDDSRALLSRYENFDIELLRRERGIALALYNPPESAFVDDKMIINIQYHLFAVLRDILFVHILKHRTNPWDIQDSRYLTNQVFDILRNARALHSNVKPNLVVCWGGHSINEVEYAYCRAVGCELGYRELNIVTGCGAGVMEAPMKGAAIAHANQRYKDSRFIGITEPSIIASEAPNPIVNELVIMPDIEKRLEAFVRLGHGILIFPGGPGTFEEFLYVLGIKMHPKNQDLVLPLILTGPKECEGYFNAINQFMVDVFGENIRQYYDIIIDDPNAVAKAMNKGIEEVTLQRQDRNDAYCFNWSLYVEEELQKPFQPTHENMATLNLYLDQPEMALVANLRRAFSGIVAGNIKPAAQDAIAKYGKFKLHGESALMQKMDKLLRAFIQQDRMKLPTGTPYEPCYEIVHDH
ncbi:nucleotide 5'-monophosphate nucleosidase PpnN [Actinobacillus delphinicola]|uniref:AMP nucleosidase n=1 Tax=Actinobacillus delphinicola TaxID=51161 RepID=A0A448TVX4_9PAST|nr:nucleotide 5'-monophosphate nucleosidase PpnN [Actinobacillus delphinicola]VEJ10077.1 Rossmann fold nucleotide-binding protein [Actinobacillus delphinicola]